LKAAGSDVIRAEKRSGTTTQGREELRTVLDFLRQGDVLMVTRIDRLARSIGDLQDIVRAVRACGAVMKATEQREHISEIGLAPFQLMGSLRCGLGGVIGDLAGGPTTVRTAVPSAPAATLV
jgi:Resolvase, N terminal domain